MKVVAIVVTYNGNKWITKCLNSLKNSTLEPHIIVVDNASSDNTRELVRNNFPSVLLISLPLNIGFGGANNYAIREALLTKPDYLFLLNQDAWIQKDCLLSLANALASCPELGIISPFHMNYEGNSIEKYFNDYVLGQYTPSYSASSSKSVYMSHFIHAAAWLLPIPTVVSIGGFDPLFLHTGEDNDYTQRLHSRHLKIGFSTKALVFHHGTNSGLILPSHNYRLIVNTYLIKLKNPSASFGGAVFLFLKNWSKTFAAAIVKPDWLKVSVLLKAIFYVLTRAPRIIKSRKIQQLPFAFLELNKKLKKPKVV